jgi:hypothetical protein
MTDLAITQTNVVPVSPYALQQYPAGTYITAGQVVYPASGQAVLAKADSSVHATALGIAMNGGSSGQIINILTRTGDVCTIGATVVAGVQYYVSRNNFGGIMTDADFMTNDYVTPLCYGISTTQVKMNIQATGIQHG